MTAHPITRIALVQLLLAIVGFFTLAIMMKLKGYPNFSWVHWRPEAIWLRHYGLLVLLVPLGWSIASIACERKWPHEVSNRVHVVTGIGVALYIFFGFLVVALNPDTHPTFKRSAQSAPAPKISKRFQSVEKQTAPSHPEN